MYYLNYFFLFSILGHILESFCYADGKSGILFGWWTPVYGIGVIIILLVNKWLSKFNLKPFFKVLWLFLINAVLLSIIEAIGGYLIKWFLHTELWDYSGYKFNIGKYTALEMSLLWGSASILFVYILKPLFDKIISKIPKYFTYILIILFISDLALTLIIKH